MADEVTSVLMGDDVASRRSSSPGTPATCATSTSEHGHIEHGRIDHGIPGSDPRTATRHDGDTTMTETHDDD